MKISKKGILEGFVGNAIWSAVSLLAGLVVARLAFLSDIL